MVASYGIPAVITTIPSLHLDRRIQRRGGFVASPVRKMTARS